MMNGEENQAHSRPEGQEDALPEKKRTWLLPLLSSLLFGFTLFVFAPLETWFSAGAELWFTVEDFLWPALAAFLTVSGVLFGVGMLLRGAGRSAFWRAIVWTGPCAVCSGRLCQCRLRRAGWPRD